MKKVLILGASGNLGLALCQLYGGLSGYTVIAWGSKELDVTKEKEVMRMIAWFVPDFIYNCAAYTDVDGAEKENDRAQSVNAYAAGYIAKAAQHVGAVLVYYSTNYVFRGNSAGGYSEDSAVDPLNAYGLTKLYGEQASKRYATNLYVVRTSNLFGSSITGKPSFIDKVLAKAVNGNPFPCVSDEFIQPTYTKDLAQASKELVEGKARFGTYHIVNSGKLSPQAWTQLIFRTKGISLEVPPCSRNDYAMIASRPQDASLISVRNIVSLRSHELALREYLQVHQS